MIRSRLAWIAVLVAFLIGLGVFLGVIVPWVVRSKPEPKRYDTATILKQVQGLSELVTVKFVFEKAVRFDDAERYAIFADLRKSSILLLAHGVVKAGVDLSQLKPEDVQVSGSKVVVTLPRAVVTDAYLDDRRTQVFEHSTGVFSEFNKDLEPRARSYALAEIQRAARQGGIEQEGDTRAREQLNNFFHSLGFAEVEFRTRTSRPK